MRRPRREMAGNELGRRFYHRRWDVQDRSGSHGCADEFTTGDETGNEMGRQMDLPQEMGRPRWEVAGNELGRRIYQEMGRPRWEMAGNEMGRRIYHKPRWEVAGNELGRGIYQEMGRPRRWDVQDPRAVAGGTSMR